MEHLNIELYQEDFSFIICKIDSLIEETQLGKIYGVLPNVKDLGMGNTKQVARILTDFDLKVGNYYIVKGHIETIKLNSEIVPTVFVTQVKVIPKNSVQFYKDKSLTESYRNYNLSYVTNLVVEKIVGKGKTKLIKLVKYGQNQKHFFKTDLVGVTTSVANEEVLQIKEGDTISILCGIDRIESLNNKKQFEVGLHIFKINPTEGIVEDCKYQYDNLIPKRELAKS